MNEHWAALMMDGVPIYVRASDGAARAVLFASSYPDGTEAVTSEQARRINRAFTVERGADGLARWKMAVMSGPSLLWLDPADPIAGPGSTVDLVTP